MLLTRMRCPPNSPADRAHDADDAVLGRAVVNGVGGAAQAEHRALRQDDRAAAARDEVRQRGLHGVPHAGEVDGDGLQPGGVVHLEGGDGLVDARIRHHDVEPAELGDAVVECCPQRRGIPHIRLVRHDPPVQGLDLADRLGQVLLGGQRVGRHGRDRPGDVDRDDVRALLGEPDGVAAALAARRAGDESDLALHPSWHQQLLLSRGLLLGSAVPPAMATPAAAGPRLQPPRRPRAHPRGVQRPADERGHRRGRRHGGGTQPLRRGDGRQAGGGAARGPRPADREAAVWG